MLAGLHLSQTFIDTLELVQQFRPMSQSKETAEWNKNIMTQSELLLHKMDYMGFTACTETTEGQRWALQCAACWYQSDRDAGDEPIAGIFQDVHIHN